MNNTELPKILITGKFTLEDLIVSVSESTRKIDPDTESKLEGIWEEKIKHAQENGKNCYNGLSYRLNSIQEKDSKIVLDFGIIEYKVRDGLIAVPEYYDLPEEYYRKGCFTCSSVKTSDGKYIMVELSGKSMNPNTTDLIGGIMETDISMNTGSDIFESLYKEFTEEADIKKEDIKECYLNTIYFAHGTNIAFYFETTLGVSSVDLIERFKNNKDADIKSLCIYTRDEYLDALKKHNSLNKQIVGNLLQI